MKKIEGQFDGYILRRTDYDLDVMQLSSWIAQDRYHVNVMRPSYFLGQIEGPNGELAPDPRPSCYALEDQDGTIFFIRLSRAARVQMQFGPSRNPAQRTRNATALIKGMAFLEAALSRVGTEQWIFDSYSAPLRRMARDRLGFTESQFEMVRPIAPPEPQQGPAEGQQEANKGVT